MLRIVRFTSGPDRIPTIGPPLLYQSGHYVNQVSALSRSGLREDVEEIPLQGFLDQGPPYAFDGNDVTHVSAEGTITHEGWFPTDSGVIDLEHRCAFPVLGSVSEYLEWYPNVYYGYGSYAGFHEVDGQEVFVWSSMVNTSPSSGDARKSTPVSITYWNPTNNRWYSRTSYISYQHSKGNSRDIIMSDVASFHLSLLQFLATGLRVPTSRIYPSYSPLLSEVSVDPTRLFHGARKLCRRFNRHGNAYNILMSYAEPYWADLAHQCVDGQRSFNGNAIAWAQKLGSWGGEIKAALALAGDIKNPKAWASTWLSFRFGSRLECKTSLDMLDAVWDKFLTIPKHTKYDGYTVSRSRKNVGLDNGQTLELNARLVCASESNTNLMTSVKKLMEWGAWPSLNNAFDLIPLSFVVDWATNVSTILDNVDDLVYKQYLKTLLWERSVKLSLPISLLDNRDHATADTRITLYTRNGSTQLPDFSVLAGWEPTIPSPIHLVDGASLLLQFFA